MAISSKKQQTEEITRYADMLAAMGTEPRLRIMQLLLSAHPEGLVVNEIGTELDIPSSTLSHHLEKLKHEDLVRVRAWSACLSTPGRDSQFAALRPRDLDRTIVLVKKVRAVP